MMPVIDLDKMANEAGLVVYDTALPQDFWNEFYKYTGQRPHFIVWCYDKASMFGKPEGVTPEAKTMLEVYKHVKDNHSYWA